MNWAGLWTTDPAQAYRAAEGRIVVALRSAGPALLCGLRLWAAVVLALYIAFWLQLDNAYWAGTSAAIVSQPSLGASLRKGWFRMVGTMVGAAAIVVLTACFVQDRLGFLVAWRSGTLRPVSWQPCCATLRATRRRWPVSRRP